jgi:soluble lytic murein transglycosylase-like protein
VAASILGPSIRQVQDLVDSAPLPDVGWPSRRDLPCDDAVRSRDQTAWQMGISGYSAAEIADVLSGHLTIADLDQARVRLMTGQPRATVSAFLEARWRDTSRLIPAGPIDGDVALGADLDRELNALAREHHVAPELIRAMIAAESGGDVRARSSAGAIGLMQLMPATAAAFGVNPWRPAENLRGRIAYIGELLRAYGENARLALIAYNAGPQHANRVRSGNAVAYRETRRYLDVIGARYSLP